MNQKDQIKSNIKQTYSWLSDEILETTYNMALNDYLAIKYPSLNNRPLIENINSSNVEFYWVEIRMRDILSRAGISLSSYKENNLNLTYGSSYIDKNLASLIKPKASVPR